MPNARLYKTEAVVLRQRRLGDADRLLTIYTTAYGKLVVKAKGVRRTTSRMSGHLQPLTRCMLQLAQGHTSDVVAGCETLESFQPLHEDLDRLSRAVYVAELIDRMMPEKSPGMATYRLVVETLRRLASDDGGDMVLRHFEMTLLGQNGFQPELGNCTGCGTALEPVENFFAPRSGGMVCPSCASDSGGARAMSLTGLKVLRLLQRGSYEEAARLRIEAELATELERHLRSYIVCVLERDVNAAAFMERLRREARRLPART